MSGHAATSMAFDAQPVLTGALVRLRPLQRADYQALHDVAADQLIWAQHPSPDRHTEAGFGDFFEDSIASGGALIAIDARTGAVIGASRFHGYDAERGEVEIGWTFLARTHWGGRYNGEMKRLMLHHAFRFVRTVVCLVAPDNVRSQRAVEKIGGVRTGTRADAGGCESYVYEFNAPPRTSERRIDVDTALVRRLLESQWPERAAHTIEPVDSAGTDHALFRLGDRACVRLPRVDRAVEQVHKEQRWLPVLSPSLPLATPEPLMLGTPGAGYPWHWSIYGWLDGQDASQARPADMTRVAQDLARFVAALRAIDPSDGPHPGEHNFERGEPLAARDARTRESISNLGDSIDVDAVARLWDTAVNAPAWPGPPVWIHGDLQAGNLLVEDGRLTAVIDFGGLGVGDPACDLIIAWNLLPAGARVVFREALDVDEATWLRGCGWALSVSAIALPYYRDTNPAIVATARHTIGELLAACTP